jgi:hypothetical protein
MPPPPRAADGDPARPAIPAPSQATKPLRVAPGAAAAHGSSPVETLAGPFPRIPSPPSAGASSGASGGARPAPADRPPPEPRQPPPPGMSDADVNALYTKYVQAKQILGEEAEPGTYGKLLKTINAQAPKIMEQYKSKGVDFSIVVKDNQVIIRAKPKP